MLYKFSIIIFISAISIVAAASNCSISCGPFLLFPINMRDTWEPVTCAGISLQCSTNDSNTFLEFSTNYGVLRSKNMVIRNQVLYSEISLSYKVLDPSDFISIKAVISLANLAVKMKSNKPIDEYSLIASWENEFGTAAGIVIVLHPVHNLILKLPIKPSVIFSSPKYFYSVSTGLSLGYQFGSGAK